MYTHVCILRLFLCLNLEAEWVEARGMSWASDAHKHTNTNTNTNTNTRARDMYV